MRFSAYLGSKWALLGLASLLLFLLLDYAVVTRRSPGPVEFDTLLIFGDSYSDNGVSKEDPYGRKRATDGYVWNEHVAWALQLNLRNYGHGGACSDFTHNGTLWQVDQMLKDLGGRVPETFLIGYQATGQNDFHRIRNADPEKVAENNVEAIRQLLSAGASSIFVLNTFNVSLQPHLHPPKSVAEDPTNRMIKKIEENRINKARRRKSRGQEFEEFVRTSNGWLSLKLSEIPSSQKNKVTLIDFFEMSNVFGKKFIHQVYDPMFSDDPKDNYGFYDGVHPSGTGHKWLGEQVVGKLRQYWPELNRRRNNSMTF